MLYHLVPKEFFIKCRNLGIHPSSFLCIVRIKEQAMDLFKRNTLNQSIYLRPAYEFIKTYVISTSRFGIGNEAGSYKTPTGLHKIAQKIGHGLPPGAVFKARNFVGYTWQGFYDAKIAHRILWIEGLEPNVNQGDGVDSFKRFIYIHGLAGDYGLGRPASCGCIHMSCADVIQLFEKIPVGTLVWIF